MAAIATPILLLLGMVVADPVFGETGLDVVLEKTRHEWRDNELSIEALSIDLEQEQRENVDAAQAAEDVGRLFDLFAHGYAGYGFFSEGDRWNEARKLILEDLAARPEWAVTDLPKLIRRRLPFVRDCHLEIGSLSFAAHRDFWFDDSLEILERGDGFVAEVGGEEVELISVDGQDPREALVPSLSRRGQRIHRIGRLSAGPPAPVVVEGTAPSGPVRFEVSLRRSSFDHYSRKPFQKDVVGGIPVLRVRTFSDFHEESLAAWVGTAETLRDAPCVVVDVRGNRGGNERWPIEWIRRLTGRYAGSPLVFSELHSRTTIAGRYNAFAYWLAASPESEFLSEETAAYRKRLERLGPDGDPPAWSEPRFPPALRIPSDTVVVIVTNGLVGSAGEGFVMRASRLSNTVVVGENTRGALTFGNVSLHRLPHSGLDVWMPINVNLFTDGVFREEMGLEPDFWVPARDAVDAAVAAVRSGTIPTVRPIPPEDRRGGFIGENARRLLRRAGLAGLALLVGVLVALRARRMEHRLTYLGAVWLVIGPAWIILGDVRNKPLITDLGFGMLVFGFVLSAVGLARWVREIR